MIETFMPHLPKLNMSAGKLKIEKIEDSIKNAISHASELGKLFKEIALIGKTTANVLGIFSILYEIKKLWTDEEEQEKHNIFSKIGISLLYSGYIAFSVIATIVLFGVSVIAAPIVTAIISGISFVINIVEFVKEVQNVRKMKTKLDEKVQLLAQENVSFNRNLTLYREIALHREEINLLKLQKLEFENQIKLINQEPHKNTLLKIIGARKKLLKEKIIAEKILISDLGNMEILLEAKNNLMNTGAKETDKKIIVLNIMIDYYQDLKILQEEIKFVNKQMEGIEEKYKREPYQSTSKEKVIQLKSLEEKYLNERKRSLEWALEEKRKIEVPKIEYHNFLEIKQNPNLLKKELENNLNSITREIKEKEKLMQGKVEYFGKTFANDPKQEIKIQAGKILQQTNEIIELNNKIALEKIQRNQRGKNIILNGIILGFAISLCIPPAWPFAAILGSIMAVAGIVAFIGTVYDRVKRANMIEAFSAEKKSQITGVLQNLDSKLKHGFAHHLHSTNKHALTNPKRSEAHPRKRRKLLTLKEREAPQNKQSENNDPLLERYQPKKNPPSHK